MLMFPFKQVLSDLSAAGFSTKELMRKNEEELAYIYDSLIMDSILWQRHLQKPDPEHPGYPDPRIDIATTLAEMTVEEKAALRARLRNAQ